MTIGRRLDLRGGSTNTVFPRVEERLCVVRETIESIPDNGLAMEDFQSLMDWFYVRVFPNAYDACQAYYADKGPPLRDRLSKRVLKAQERHMLAFLTLCEALAKQDALEALGGLS
jgi:hypothetical protein